MKPLTLQIAKAYTKRLLKHSSRQAIKKKAFIPQSVF